MRFKRQTGFFYIYNLKTLHKNLYIYHSLQNILSPKPFLNVSQIPDTIIIFLDTYLFIGYQPVNIMSSVRVPRSTRKKVKKFKHLWSVDWNYLHNIIIIWFTGRLANFVLQKRREHSSGAALCLLFSYNRTMCFVHKLLYA